MNRCIRFVLHSSRNSAALLRPLLLLFLLSFFGCGGGGGSNSGSGQQLGGFLSPVSNSFFGLAFKDPCSITNTGPTGPCGNPEFHSFPSVPFGWARSLGSGEMNMKWSDIVQCDPTGKVCPVAGSGCSKDGLSAGGAQCPAAELVANCQPNLLAPDDPTNCAYNWATFDYWTIMYNAHGIDWMFTPYNTPDYLSVRGSRCTGPGQADFGPDATCLAAADVCQNQIGLMWGCDPPFDIDFYPGSGFADGTNQNYINFVSALGLHAFNNFESVKYWEIWTEPDSCSSWNHSDQSGTDCTKLNPGGGPSFGTVYHFARMATDTKSAIAPFLKGVKIVSPSFASVVTNSSYLGYMLSIGPTAFDSIGYHGDFFGPTGCPNQCPVPEMEVADWKAVLDAAIVAGIPTKSGIDTQFSWGPASNVVDPDMRIALLARSFLLQESYYPQLARAFWVGRTIPWI